MILDNILGNREILGSKRFFVRGSLPTLNEYTKASRGNIYASAKMKKNAEEIIIWEARSQLKGWKTEHPVFLCFHWIEKDKRRDHDNVAFAKKFVQDALVNCGILLGDGWKHVVGFVDLFSIDKNNQGVEVTILEVADEKQGKVAVDKDKQLHTDRKRHKSS